MIMDWLPFIGGLIAVCMAIIVFSNGTNQQGTRLPFTFFALSVGVWSMGITLFSVSQSPSFALAVATTYYIAALGIAYAFFVFSHAYTKKQLSSASTVLASLPFLFVAVFVALPGVFLQSVEIGASNSVSLSLDWYWIYTVLFSVFVVYGLLLLWRNAFDATRSQRHRPLLAVALTVCFAGGAYFNLYLPLTGVYTLIAFGPMFSFLLVATIFYAIARHRLFDIRVAVVRGVAYLLTLFTLAALYLLIAFFVFTQLLGQVSSIDQTILNVSLALLLAFVFQPIKRFFDHITNRLFFRDVYDPDEFYRRLNKTLTSTTDLHALLRRTAYQIAETMNAERAQFIVHTDSGALIEAGTEGFRSIPAKDVAVLEQNIHVIGLKDDMPDSPTRRMLISHRMEVVMKLTNDDRTLGFFCLGQHQSAQFTKRDMRVLQTIRDELVIAIQNAISVKNVRDLNASLERRIAAATKELRASNAELKKLDEAKDEFISMASHQLRTPLTSVKGYISMLMEGDVGHVTKDQKKLLEEAFMSSERMVRLIGDFLNVSRLQTGKFVIDKHPVDMAQLVEDELDALSTNAATRGLHFSYRKPKKIPVLALDENKIQQVIMNFSDNALYYSKEKTKIIVRLKVVDGWLEFTVKDTGIGVPKEQQEHLFQKFFRATNARQQRPDGTGVGLFLAKKVIDAHGGEIIFSSVENKGSTFGFKLPIEKLRA